MHLSNQADIDVNDHLSAWKPDARGRSTRYSRARIPSECSADKARFQATLADKLRQVKLYINATLNGALKFSGSKIRTSGVDAQKTLAYQSPSWFDMEKNIRLARETQALQNKTPASTMSCREKRQVVAHGFCTENPARPCSWTTASSTSKKRHKRA